MAAGKETWGEYCENYEVSNFGNVRSLDHETRTKSGHVRSYKGKVLSFGYIEGYPVVNISGKAIKVHKMVASLFIGNPSDYPVINHIDGNKKNNRFDNLEWCTQQQNCIHAFQLGLRKPAINLGYNNGFSKEVENIVTGQRYGSLKELIRKVNIDIKYSTIRAQLSGQNTNITNYRYVCSRERK